MLDTAQGWSLSVERGPDWLFIRLNCLPDAAASFANLAEQLWHCLQQHFTYRVVLELDGVPLLTSNLLGQLVLLHKRLHTHGGVMRLCGLTPMQQEAILCSRLDTRLPAYPTREAAIWGHRPTQPR